MALTNIQTTEHNYSPSVGLTLVWLQLVNFTALAPPLTGDSVHHLHALLGLVRFPSRGSEQSLSCKLFEGLLVGLMSGESKFQTLILFLHPSTFN